MKTLACWLLLGITASGCALQAADEESDEYATEAAEMDPGLETTSVFERGSVTIEVDEDGFLSDPENWSEDVETALTGENSARIPIRRSVCSPPLGCR